MPKCVLFYDLQFAAISVSTLYIPLAYTTQTMHARWLGQYTYRNVRIWIRQESQPQGVHSLIPLLFALYPNPANVMYALMELGTRIEPERSAGDAAVRPEMVICLGLGSICNASMT